MGSLNCTTPAFNHADHSPLNAMSHTHIFNKVHDFQKGIKCNIILNPIFMDDQQYSSWYHETHAITSVHGTEAVFDPHYRTTETSQALLWIEIKCFLFSVFCKNLQASA